MPALSQAILKSLSEPQPERRVTRLETRTEAQNQALLMLKPECFLQGPEVAKAVIDLILGTVTRFRGVVGGAVTLDGSVLDRLGTIDRHYRLASELSGGASHLVIPEDLEQMKRLCEVNGDLPVWGGHEYLAQHPELSPAALDEAWFQRRPRKVRSGFYTVPFEHEGRPCLLVNGFYPAQAHHFTAPGRTVVLLLLHSDMPWRVMRREMLGDTYPEKALPGSIRRSLLEQRESLGLPRVDITSNFVHLSAGPFEAAWELVNFFGGLDTAFFPLANSRLATFWAGAGEDFSSLDTLVRSGQWFVNGLTQDLFSCTEDLDTRAGAHYVSRMGR